LSLRDDLLFELSELHGAILLTMQIDPVQEWQRLTAEYRQKGEGELLELADDYADLTPAAQQVLRSEMRTRGLGDPASPRAGAARETPEASFYTPPPELSRPLTAASEAPPPKNYAQEGANTLSARLADLFGSRPPELVPDTPASDDESNGPHDYTWKTVLCECDTTNEAWQITEALRRAGIESWIDRRQAYSPNHARLTGVPNLELIGMSLPRVLVAADQLDQARLIAAQPIPQKIVDESNQEAPEFVEPKCPKCGSDDVVLEGVDPENTWRCEQCDTQWTETPPNPEGDPEKTPQNAA
jgi:hypothetical protein